MLEHFPSAVDRFVAPAIAPIRIDPLVLSAAPALLGVMVIQLGVGVNRPAAPIAPKNGESSGLFFPKLP